LKAPSRRVERTIREALDFAQIDPSLAARVPEAVAWLDGEKARNAIRGHCKRCGHTRAAHDNSEPEIGVVDTSCNECSECEEYVA
jgi:hypothetical protein